MVSKFKCEYEYTEYLRETKYTLVIYQASCIQILINQLFSNVTKYKQISAKGWKTEIELFTIYHSFSDQDQGRNSQHILFVNVYLCGAPLSYSPLKLHI